MITMHPPQEDAEKFLSIYKLEKELVLLQLPRIVAGSIQNPGGLKTSSAACGGKTGW